MTVVPPSTNSDKPGSSKSCRVGIFLPDVVLRLTECLLDDYYYSNHLHLEFFIFLRSTWKRSLPLGFLCANKALAYLEKGKTVFFPYLCIRVNSKIRYSFSWFGMGRLRLYPALSIFRRNFQLELCFHPIIHSVSGKIVMVFNQNFFN